MKKIYIFFFLTITIFSNDVDNLKNKVKKIDTEIKQKNTRIITIDSEKISVEKQIENINKEIRTIEQKISKIESEISVVNKNIDYGTLNLDVSNKALDKSKSEFKAKMIEVNRISTLTNYTKPNSVAKRSFSRLLYSDLEKMDHIKNVKFSIVEVKNNIENNRKKLRELKSDLDRNKVSVEKKKIEKNRLIAELNNEKNKHTKTISMLQKEKKNIEKEIEKIIRARTKQTSNIKLDTALLKLGKFEKPIFGKVVVKFKTKKNNEVISNGIEIAGKMGLKVKASNNGKVIYADKFQGLNNVVMIDYGYNTIGVYGNLIAVRVKLNQQVTKGEDIGVLGATSADEANLYYEVRFNLQPINPENLF